MRRLFLLIVLLLLTLPLQAQESQDFSITDILLTSASAEEAEFTIFLFVLSEVDFELLNSLGRTDSEWTVFAPSDAAFLDFMDVNDLSIQDLVADEAFLRDLLHYHIIEGTILYGDLAEQETVAPLLADSEITITFGDTLLLNGSAEIIVENYATSNGVIHVLSQVLLSPSALEVYSLPEPEVTAEPEATEAAEAGD